MRLQQIIIAQNNINFNGFVRFCKISWPNIKFGKLLFYYCLGFNPIGNKGSLIL